MRMLCTQWLRRRMPGNPHLSSLVAGVLTSPVKMCAKIHFTYPHRRLQPPRLSRASFPCPRDATRLRRVPR